MNQIPNPALLAEAKPLATPPTAAQAPSSPRRRRSRPRETAWVRRLAIPFTGVLLAGTLTGLVVTRWDSWQSRANVQVTDNAVVRAELTRLSARISGNVKRVAVNEFQRVRSGDLLVEIDPADYEAELTRAETSVAAAQAALDNLGNQKAHQRGIIAEAEAKRLSALARCNAIHGADRRGACRPASPAKQAIVTNTIEVAMTSESRRLAACS